MGKILSIHLGEYYERLIREEVLSGRYDSESDVIKSALRVFEKEEIRARSLINELEKGEKSEKILDFERNKNLKDLHEAFDSKNA
jgi:antitoxin ParD1/3/4